MGKQLGECGHRAVSRKGSRWGGREGGKISEMAPASQGRAHYPILRSVSRQVGNTTRQSAVSAGAKGEESPCWGPWLRLSLVGTAWPSSLGVVGPGPLGQREAGPRSVALRRSGGSAHTCSLRTRIARPLTLCLFCAPSIRAPLRLPTIHVLLFYRSEAGCVASETPLRGRTEPAWQLLCASAPRAAAAGIGLALNSSCNREFK